MTEPREKRHKWLRELYDVNPNNLSMREREELDALDEIVALEAERDAVMHKFSNLVANVEGLSVGLEIAATDSNSWSLDVAEEQRRISGVLGAMVRS